MIGCRLSLERLESNGLRGVIGRWCIDCLSILEYGNLRLVGC